MCIKEWIPKCIKQYIQRTILKVIIGDFNISFTITRLTEQCKETMALNNELKQLDIIRYL